MNPNNEVFNVIRRNKDGSVILNEKNLKEILLQTNVKDLPVAFYSICGSLRTGKSFLWNLFIHYLKDKSKYLKQIGTNNKITKYFKWKGGVERHTEGILIFKEPFFLQTSKYGKVAVFLMDTQGMFDNMESGENCGMIVALSFLLASVQVYNILNTIESSHLQYCYKFSKVWKVVTGEEDKKKGPCADSLLMFAVRDWKKKKTHKLGLDGGKGYVENWMKIRDEQAEDQRHVRREIIDNFLGASGCLLPEPGEDIVDEDPEPEENIIDKDPRANERHFNEVDTKFYQYSKELFDHLVDEKNIVVKKVKGNVVTASQLCEHITEIADQGKGFKGVSENFRTFVENDYRTKMRKIIKKCLDNYMEEMCNKFQEHVEKGAFEWKTLLKENKKPEKQDSLEKSEKVKGSSETNLPNNLPEGDEIGLINNELNQNEIEFRPDDNTSTRWKSYLEELGEKKLAETENDNQNWREALGEHHTNLKNKALNEYDEASKPGEKKLKNHWRSILNNLIERNYNKYEHCAKAEEVFNKLILEFNSVLRSSASGERWKRTFSPLDSATDRCKSSLQNCKDQMFREIDQTIAKQCYEYFKYQANHLLNEHRNRIKLRIGATVAAIGLVVGAAAAATLFGIPAVLAGAVASETSTALIITATVAGGATLVSSIGGIATTAKLYEKHIRKLLEDNWDYIGDDIGFIEANAEVLLSFGVVRFPQVTKLD